MKLYSDFAGRRTVQILGDLLAVTVLVVGTMLAVSIRNAIAAFDAIGRDVQRSGSDFATSMGDIGTNLSGIPLIGGGISVPFDAASAAGGTLADAGENWQSAVLALAALTGWTIGVLVVLIVVLGWVLPRMFGALRRGEASRSASAPSSLDLLAFRALATRRTQDIALIDTSAVAAWRRGDANVIRRLAELELRASGIRLDARRGREPQPTPVRETV